MRPPLLPVAILLLLALAIGAALLIPRAPEPPPAAPDLTGRHQRGPADARWQAVVFSDFRCPACARFNDSTLRQLDDQNLQDKRISIGIRHLAHLGDQSRLAAVGAECAGRQQRFWPYHDRLYELPQINRTSLRQLAADLGLAVRPFDRCLDDPTVAENIRQDTALGRKLRAPGTPAVFVNGRLLADPASLRHYAGFQ